MPEGPAVDVAFLPGEAHDADVAVAVDVLRASSTIVQALATGYRRVLCCDTVSQAEALAAPGRVLAGERDSVRIEGFDLGNSPVEIAEAEPLSHEMVLATTNGSPAIVAATRSAPRVVIGALVNLEALLETLPRDGRVSIVCAGTNGRPALEDMYLAGRVVAGLPGERSDAARVAERMAASYEQPVDALTAGSHAQVLREKGLKDDIAFCAQESVLDLTPEVVGAEGGAAIVAGSNLGPMLVPATGIREELRSVYGYSP